MSSTKTKVSAVSTPRQQSTKQRNRLAKLFSVVILSAQINGCLNIQLSGNDYPREPKNWAVSKNKNEDHIRFLIPKEVSIPKNVKVLSCVLVDKGSIEGFKRYLASGKGKEIYAIPYASYLLNQTNTVIAYEALNGQFWLIVVAGDGKGIECAAGKHFKVSFDNFKSAKDFLVWWLIFRAGRYDVWGDVYSLLSSQQDNQNYNQMVEELFSLADIFAAAMDSSVFSTIKNYPDYRQGRELSRMIQYSVEVWGSLSQRQESNQAFLDAASFCASVELLAAGIPVAVVVNSLGSISNNQDTPNEIRIVSNKVLQAFERRRKTE